jgi:hypothetical protein
MDEQGMRVRHSSMVADWASLLPRSRYFESVSDCRWIASSFGLVSGAMEQKADYICASGMRAMFDGDDDEYGDLLEDALTEADKVAGVRGPRFTTKEMCRLTIKAFATDGDVFWVPTQSESGFPQLQLIEAHRVGQRDSSKTVVESGRFKGARISAGIIMDRVGREIGFNILGAAEDGSEDVQLSAAECWHVARPKWSSEGRPLPEIAPAILDLWDVREMREAAKMQAIVNARLTLIESNQTGKADTAKAALSLPAGVPTRTLGGSMVDVVEKGGIRYIRNGNTLTAHSANMPADQWQRFDTRVSMTSLYAMGWRYEMLDLASLGGSTTRAFQDQINTTIYSAFAAIEPYVVRWRQYQAAKLTKLGILPQHPEWYKIGVTPPPEFTCDPSRSVTSDIDGVRAGLESVPMIHARNGTTSKRVLRSQARYLRMQASVAAKAGMETWQFGTIIKPGDVFQQEQNTQ